MAEVLMKKLKKVYDNEVTACHDISIDIKDKEFIVLVGPSGCGKSTILRMVAGLEEITEGELYFDGTLMNDVEPKDRDIAMVFQNYALYPHLNVYENIAFPLRRRKVAREKIDQKVREVAEILDLTDYLKRKPKALSGGQRQRVAIGRAMVREPKVFLMDEPLSNLDAKLRNQMRSEILKLRKKIDTTFIYVTHDQTEAMTLGDRIVIMNEGEIYQIGTPQDLFNRPVNRFVAGFIGSPAMNFFEDCNLQRDENGYSIVIKGKKITLSEEQQNILRRNGQGSCRVVCGIRPQHLKIGNQGISGIVDVGEMLGTEIILHVKIVGSGTAEDEEYVIDHPLSSGDEIPRSGTEIQFSTDPDFIQIFDPDSGENLLWSSRLNPEKSTPVL